MTIRDYHPSDLGYLYEICLKTGASGSDATALYSDPYLLGNYFAAPYAHFDKRAVLVLEASGRPLGYILGTTDTAAYCAWFNTVWRPGLAWVVNPDQSSQALSDNERWLRGLYAEEQTVPVWAGGYPGHLHIDLLPEAQGSGWGRRLMDAFCVRLASLGCPGVHLGVSRANSGGVAFYRRYGMKQLHEDEWTLFFGKSTAAS